MTGRENPGARLRAALGEEKPLQVVGTVNAYAAMLAERAGFRAIYLSGAGVANASFGLPDLGMTTLSDVLEETRRITGVTPLPLLVDIDTGWGNPLMIGRTIREMERAGAAGVQIEDQVAAKRCGHRPGKALVGAAEMAERIRAAAQARSDADFVIVARTDAAVEGIEAALARAAVYRSAGADIIFPEALTELGQYRRFTEEAGLPVLANMTEFGVTPLYTREELAAAGVSLALYPLSAFRAMAQAALRVYRAIRQEGTQKGVVHIMQDRAELYDILGYLEFERREDELIAAGKTGQGESKDGSG
ncbi:MAG TPA: methylisocitrate lyase [Geobacteraceae bacterium]|nr:methylisocitrate lyase [Geobacteraceae bacterium]